MSNTPTDWAPNPTEQKWHWATFREKGDGVIGRVKFFNPNEGATKYASDEPCGLLVVQNGFDLIRVTLDKPQLTRVITEALIVAGYTGTVIPLDVGIAVKLADISKYKVFAARCFFGDVPGGRRQAPPPPPPPKPEPKPYPDIDPDAGFFGDDGTDYPPGYEPF